MPCPINMSLTINNKEPLKLLTHVTYRYSQALLKNDVLRYFKAGVVLKDSDIDYEHVQILFSTKRLKPGAQNNPYIRKVGHKIYVPLLAKIDEIDFEDEKYIEFQRRVGIELITIYSCEIDINSGKVVISGEIDSELSMSTFEIGYPIGQPKLVTA